MKRIASLLLFLALAALPLGCAHSHHESPNATLSGTVTFPGTLPDNASLAVFLVENTQISGTVDVLANDILNFRKGSPVAFTISFDPAEVESENRYSLVARATDRVGRIILKSNGYMVLTRGAPTNNVNITMSPVR